MCDRAYQWSIFPSGDKGEQYVVREETWSEFVRAVNKVRDVLGMDLMAVKEETDEKFAPRDEYAGSSYEDRYPYEEETKPVSRDYCGVHNIEMKLREYGTRKWYDHRKKEGDVWYTCSGKGWKTQGNSQTQRG